MKIGVIGGSGALGQAFIKQLSAVSLNSEIHSFSRKHSSSQSHTIHHQIEYHDEDSLKKAAKQSYNGLPYDLVIVATGLLHKGVELQPEKTLRDLSATKFQMLFEANTIFPALVAKHFIPMLKSNERAVFAALSARVGSISDNRLGGWYAYRVSKAALNMVIKNLAIETRRRHKEMIILGLHPGTVSSKLSAPFQSGVKEDKLFTPEYSAQKLLEVIKASSPTDSGKCFAWDGHEIEP